LESKSRKGKGEVEDDGGELDQGTLYVSIKIKL
jgi:hypothetical protein